MNTDILQDECYICKRENLPNHFFYHQICCECGELNYAKRFQTADLSGYTALVTGGRIKIGYETTLKLLQCGASVIVTTRFPHDAGLRFSKENDFNKWKDRLYIYGLDLRHTASVEKFIDHIIDDIKTLDIIINNAAQTLRRPPLFYKHLIENEMSSENLAISSIKELFCPVQYDNIDDYLFQPNSFLPSIDSVSISEKNEMISKPAQLSQISLIPGDELTKSEFFPKQKFDKDGQQEDRRPTNSWDLRLDEVNVVEFMEVLYVNVLAPFLFNSRLKNLLKLKQKPTFIINVSAMEGNFHSPDKSVRHPHTNMAKAALNMMTRTSSQDYAQDLIYMNSVDVGWITNEKPYPLSIPENERKVKMAIDEIDGAARICDPIFTSINNHKYIYGKLLKNYKEYPW